MKTTIIYYIPLTDLLRLKPKAVAQIGEGAIMLFTNYWEVCNSVHYWKYISKALNLFISFKLINPHIKVYLKEMIRGPRLMLKDI